jgi:hypothetical protein
MWKLNLSSLFVRKGYQLLVFTKEVGVCSVSQGCISVKWLLATMEDLLLVEGSKEFLKSSMVGSKAYIIVLPEFSRTIYCCCIIRR